VVTKAHKTGKKLMAVPEGKHYTMQATPQNEILLAPYDAKNIYMRMIHNEQRPWQPQEAAVKALFNEYYGGGMNTIVFQELREARGLAYNANAYYERPGKQSEKESFYTHIITQNDKMMDCVQQFHHILDTIPQSEAAFKIAKDAVQKRLASQRTTKNAVFAAYLNAKKMGIDYDLNQKIYNDLPAVTLGGIVSFEQQQMARKPYRYLLLGDEKELDMPAIEKTGPVRRLTLEDIFGY
jgi:predicted Zn-dependent peptidase